MDNHINAAEADYLYIETSQIPNAGNGLFTAIKIYKNEVISLFKGKILSDSEAKHLANSGKDQYFINLLDGTILDSNPVECFAKYANDANGYSASTFKNNAKITLDDEENVCLIALKNIKPREEIFCSYGKSYWKKLGK
jgi:SET domain-containing protein